MWEEFKGCGRSLEGVGVVNQVLENFERCEMSLEGVGAV